MTRRAVLLVTATAVAVLLVSAPASAQENPTKLNVDKVACTGVMVSGTGLSPNSAYALSLADGFTLKPLAGGKASVTTNAKGTFKATVKASVNGVKNVQATVAMGGKTVLFAGHDNGAALKCAGMAQGKNSLPFTGPARAPLLLAVGVLLVAAGGLLIIRHTYRGRHQASW